MRAFLVPLVALLVSLVLVGCSAHPPEREDEMNTQEQFEALSERPDLDEAAATYDGIVAQLRKQLAEEFELREWENDRGPETTVSSITCRDFPDVDALDAGRYDTGGWIAEGDTVPHWNRATSILRDVGRQYGFTTVVRDVDGGEHRILELADGLGAKLRLGSAGNTTLSIRTGCHLTAEAKQRGRPITEEEADEKLWGSSTPAAPGSDGG